MILYDLQFFASKEGPGGEKTEEPTAKKLKDARKEGQVAKSKEINNAAGLIAMFLVLKFGLSYLGNNLVANFSYCYGKFSALAKMPDGLVQTYDFFIMLRTIAMRILMTVAPLFLIGFVIAFMSNYLQFKWMVTTKPMKPKWNKLNPVSGFKRMFSKQSLVNLGLSILKIALIGYVAYITIKNNFDIIYLLFNMPLWQGLGAVGSLVTNFGLKTSFIYCAVAVIDRFYQKHKFHEDNKMTKQEVKDEFKNAEGDPKVKSKQKQRMMQASRRRMMKAIPEADVVITNPTHFAVAIKYDTEIAAAPYVVAKGEDYLAQKIKEIARENGVEVVENKPLARMLYYNVDVDQQIPPELYAAVAEVLAMVYHLQGKI